MVFLSLVISPFHKHQFLAFVSSSPTRFVSSYAKRGGLVQSSRCGYGETGEKPPVIVLSGVVE